MSKLRLVTKNPLFLVVPLVAVLLFGWFHFVNALPPLNSSQTNILPNAGLDDVDDNGLPIGWQFSSDRPGATAKSEKGYGSPKLLVLTDQSTSSNGSTTITSPLATVKSGETYFYKGFYKSSAPFDLIMRTNNKDGSYTQAVVGQYPGGDQWTTVSYLFTGSPQAQTVQFTYSMTKKGQLRIDDIYLEPHPQDVYQPPAPKLSINLVSQLGRVPAGWETGDVAVQGNQRLQATLTYRSNMTTELAIDYTLPSGQHRFTTITTLPAATDWTTYTTMTETPPGAATAAILLNVKKGSATDAKDFSLRVQQSSGAHTWRRPLVSYTFDDGWESSYKNATPLLEKDGFRATYYLNPATIDTSNFMSSSDVSTLGNRGNELASHGYTHQDFTTLTGSSIDYQLKHAYQYFNEVYDEHSIDFATPFGSNDPQVTYYARKYYASLRGLMSGINTKQNLEPYNLRTFYIKSDLPPAKLAAALAETKARNGWLILVCHRVETTNQGEETITLAEFEQQLDLVKRSGITVEPVATALQEVKYQ